MNRPTVSRRLRYPVLCAIISIVGVHLGTTGVQSAMPGAGVGSLRRSAIVRAVETARPAVVNITGQKLVPVDARYSDARKRVNGMGTGVVVDPRGYVLTNYHVVQGVGQINVTTFDGTRFVARVIAHDPTTDLAIIKIPTRKPMRVIRAGSSQDILWGETVIAMGNAYGYENTVTTGIVSALHRNVKLNEQQSYRDLIQTDASINPGNSGGPLLNIDGQMIGINVAVRVGAQGIGFAIPVDQGLQVAARLMSVERLSGLWHGIIHEDRHEGAATSVVVRDVQPNSPAAKAGIRAGDVIRQVAGRSVDRSLEVECALIDSEIGASIPLAVRRNGEAMDVEIDLESSPDVDFAQHTSKAEIPAEQGSEDPAWQALGVRVRPVEKANVGQKSSKFRGGLRVVATRQGGVAEAEGIRQGDVLVGVHLWETISIDNLLYVLQDADLEEEEAVPFYVVRNGKTLTGEFDVSLLR